MAEENGVFSLVRETPMVYQGLCNRGVLCSRTELNPQQTGLIGSSFLLDNRRVRSKRPVSRGTQAKAVKVLGRNDEEGR